MTDNIVLGIVGIKNMGEFDESINYERLNVVTYNGSTYCALRETIGNLPTNSEYWQLYASKGDKGDIGEQGPKPEVGVDYFTESDKELISTEIDNKVADSVSESVGKLTSATPLVASSIEEMLDTTRIYVNTSDGNWYYYNNSEWAVGGAYQATADSDTISRLTKRIDYMVNTINGNLFNKDTITEGKYLHGSDGHEVEDVNYGYSDYIDTLGYPINVTGLSDTNRAYLYDTNKVMIGFKSLSEINANESMGTERYVRFNFSLSTKDNIKVKFKKDSDYDLNFNERKILSSDVIGLEELVNRIVVTVGSNKDYSNINDALEYANSKASKENHVDIMIDAGIYDVFTDDILTNADSSYIGLVLNDYVNIYGSGMEQTIINGVLPVDIPSSIVRNEVSTINCWKNNIIKDCTISMTNGRYALHNDDYKVRGGENSQGIFENVKFIYKLDGLPNTGLTCVPVGCGNYNGRNTKFINCIFKNETNVARPFLLHNNVDSPKPCVWEFENCDFLGGSPNTEKGGVGISSCGSNQEDVVIMKGCYSEKYINFYAQTIYAQAGGTKNEFVLRGYANEIPGYTWTSPIEEDISKIRMI